MQGGIILGPSFFSTSESSLQSKLFPQWSWIHLDCMSLLALVTYVFIVAVKTDVRLSRRSKKAFVIAEASIFLPIFAVNILLSDYRTTISTFSQSQRSFVSNSLNGRWAVTSNIVLACLLTELDLLTTKLSRLAMSASLVADLQSMIFRAILVAVSATLPSFSFSLTLYAVSSLGLLVGFILLVAKPMVVWMIRRTPEGIPMAESYVLTVVMMALVCGLLGEMTGQHMAMAPMLLGLVLPGGPPLGTTLVKRIERFVAGVFLPMFVVVSGLSVDMRTLGSGSEEERELAWLTVKVIVVSVMAKMGGVIGVGVWYGMEVRDTVVLGLMLNCRGFFELYTFRAWDQYSFADHQMYAIQIIATVVVGGGTAVLIKFLYDPSQPFTSSVKRRFVGQSTHSEELCLLLCAHGEHNAPPLIALLDTALPSPTCAYLLHLLPLEGHSNSVLAPYVPKRRRPCLTDHIVNAFSFLEYNHRGRLTVIPFIAVSPYSTMYSDVCQLALDKKAALVILPFHKQKDPETGVISVNPSVRAMNINVLHYSPCSVAIFISNGITNGTRLLRAVAVFFLGGSDDREALAFASRMAHNPNVGLSVIRLVLPQGLRSLSVEESEEERLDEEAMAELRAMHGENKRVDYREEEVSEGAEMIEAVKGASTEYSLVVVGRREGERSMLTEGMEMWNEYPELGVVGDVLATTHLLGSMSTLVVQRRPKRK